MGSLQGFDFWVVFKVSLPGKPKQVCPPPPPKKKIPAQNGLLAIVTVASFPYTPGMSFMFNCASQLISIPVKCGSHILCLAEAILYQARSGNSTQTGKVYHASPCKLNCKEPQKSVLQASADQCSYHGVLLPFGSRCLWARSLRPKSQLVFKIT